MTLKYALTASAFFAAVLCAGDAGADDMESKESEYWLNTQVKISREYDPWSGLTNKNYFRDDGTLEKNEKYDTYGKRVEVSFYDNRGRLQEGVDGWAAIRWKWYEDGTLAEQSYYGPDGHLRQRKLFNSLGDLVARQLVDDGALNPYEQFRPVSVRRVTDIVYDQYGNEEGRATRGR
jgi:hypothetical protein